MCGVGQLLKCMIMQRRCMNVGASKTKLEGKQRGTLGHPQCVAKSSSISGIWLLELVPYTVKLVLKVCKLESEHVHAPMPNFTIRIK
jgi:hypothetical protein